MQRLLKTLSIATLLAASTISGAHAGMTTEGNIQILQPWVQPSEGTQSSGHTTISNDGLSTIALVSIETPVAEEVVITKAGQALDRVVVIGRDEVRFDGEPFAIALVGLSRPLVAGSHFPATFHFADGATVELRMVVGDATDLSEMDRGPNLKSGLGKLPVALVTWSQKGSDIALLHWTGTAAGQSTNLYLGLY